MWHNTLKFLNIQGVQVYINICNYKWRIHLLKSDLSNLIVLKGLIYKIWENFTVLLKKSKYLCNPKWIFIGKFWQINSFKYTYTVHIVLCHLRTPSFFSRELPIEVKVKLLEL